jgi:hypothetical protein
VSQRSCAAIKKGIPCPLQAEQLKGCVYDEEYENTCSRSKSKIAYFVLQAVCSAFLVDKQTSTMK